MARHTGHDLLFFAHRGKLVPIHLNRWELLDCCRQFRKHLDIRMKYGIDWVEQINAFIWQNSQSIAGRFRTITGWDGSVPVISTESKWLAWWLTTSPNTSIKGLLSARCNRCKCMLSLRNVFISCISMERYCLVDFQEFHCITRKRTTKRHAVGHSPSHKKLSVHACGY